MSPKVNVHALFLLVTPRYFILIIQMRKDEIELLSAIQKIQKNQLYLLQQPKSPQQQFLHLFAHRHLLKQKMLNINIDKVMNHLQGSFAQSTLKIAYTTLCIENNIQLPDESSPLLNLIRGWVPYYATLSTKNKILINKIILQQENSIDVFNGYDGYLAYLHLISIDLWKLIRRNKNQAAMFAQTDIKKQLNQCAQLDFKHLEANDLLTFISSCIPKLLLNIVLSENSLPLQMRSKFPKFQCLFSNRQVEYNLRTKPKLAYLLKQILVILITLPLNTQQQKTLMLFATRYYYAFHLDKKLSATELFIFAYNKLDQSVRNLLFEEFVLFFTVIHKLGKDKFLDFMHKNSEYLRQIITIVRSNSMVGCSQQTASPYNTIGAGQIIVIGKGESAFRTFQVLEQFSLVYFKISIQNLDISVKLFYLGQITSEATVKKLLFTQEKKSGGLKTCINAMKKGLYMFEFDNTYSWITGKVIKYQNIVFAPLQIKNVNQQSWIDQYYENIDHNTVLKEDRIYIITNKKTNPQLGSGIAAISKNKNLYSLKINKTDQQYIYETDHPLRLEQRIREIMKEKDKYRWTLFNEPVKNFSQIQTFIHGKQNTKVEGENQRRSKTEYNEQKEEEIQEETEYEVVSKQMEKSSILTVRKNIQEQYADEHQDEDQEQEQEQEIQQQPKSRRVQPAAKPKPIVQKKKDQIVCNLDQSSQFYD